MESTDFEPKEVVVLVNEARIPNNDIFGDSEIDSPIKPEPKSAPVVEERNEAVELLRGQLAEKQREAEEAKHMRAQAEQLAYQREQEVRQYASQAQDSKHTAFVNAIASFERDAESLENQYADALANGDNHGAAKVHRQMIQIESRLSQLHQGREAIEEQLASAKVENYQPQPQQEQPRYRQPQNEVSEAISRLSPESAAWVSAHPEVIRDPEANSLMSAAHHQALKQNIPVDTPEYFAHLDKMLGFGRRQQQPRTQKVMTAAPVSRGGSGNYQAGNQVSITLTPEQRAYAADVLGVTDEEYADGLLYYANKGKLNL